MAGNRLGPRTKVVYKSEANGLGYILTVDDSFVVAGAGTGNGEPALYDPATPPADLTVTPSPKSFRPRGVWAKSPVDGARKFIACMDPTADLYATTTPKTVSIDGENFITTGRVGETQSF